MVIMIGFSLFFFGKRIQYYLKDMKFNNEDETDNDPHQDIHNKKKR